MLKNWPAKIREQLVVKSAEERNRAGMIWSERGRAAEKFTSGGIAAFVRLGNFGELFKFWMFEKIAQVAEGILVWHEVNAEFAAACSEDLDFLCCWSAPNSFARRVWYFRSGERVLGAVPRCSSLILKSESFSGEGRAAAFQLRHAAAPRCRASRRDAQNPASRGCAGRAGGGRIRAAIAATSAVAAPFWRRRFSRKEISIPVSGDRQRVAFPHERARK